MGIESLQSKYRLERDGISVVETEEMYFAYKTVEDELHVEEVYIREDLRGNCKQFYDTIKEMAVLSNFRYIVVSFVPGTIGAERSAVSILKYGFKLHSIRDGRVICIMEL
jgi:AAA+ superfamily predicted ATPase